MYVVVVGAGLAGLAAASLLARAGAEVKILERAAELGGRARSQAQAGAWLNLGPRALYEQGAGRAVLEALGVDPAGARPPSAGLALRGGVLHALPASPGSLFGSTALGFGEKLRALARLLPLGEPPDQTVAAWLADAPAGSADLVRATIRVSSYCNAPELQAARAARRQVAAALRGVRYLDGGWGAMVGALRRSLPAGVGIAQEDVRALPDADAVVLASSPAHARALGLALPALRPVRAACLDLVLDGLPRPEARFVLGLDQPLYLSEHGAVARLGGTVLHVMRYLAPGDRGVEARAELEALLDLAQPGWRARLRFERFLPELVVSHRVDEVGQVVPAEHRVEGRPVWLAGDWVGEVGMLADRALYSGAEAARGLLRGAARARAAA